MAENQALLRPWMVRDTPWRRSPSITRPPAADHPDQRWHTDLTMWWFDAQWFWMIDILDAYSRYLVHSVNFHPLSSQIELGNTIVENTI